MLAVLSVFAGAPVSASTTCEKIEKTIYMVDKLHYQPPTWNVAFASKTIEQFLYFIDGQGLLLYARDIHYLKEIQRKQLTIDEIFCKSHQYILKVYSQRLKETDSMLNEMLHVPGQWRKHDSLTIYRSYHQMYATDRAQKMSTLNKWVKLYMLNQMNDDNNPGKQVDWDKQADLRAKTIHKLRKNLNRKTKSGEQAEAYLEENLLQALMSTIDPHSSYFTSQENKHFTESLSASVEVYGFSYNENQHEQIQISSVMPGSPAWKCNKLNEGDLIVKVKFKHQREVDVSGFDADEFYELMSSHTGKEITITVLKKNGATEEVKLAKALVQSDENKVNSYILGSTHPVGYISLPSFYTDFTGKTADGCANDVAREIMKLMADSIRGLILDLRNNGGGSVEEATNLAGIFIDAAPLYLLKASNYKPMLIKDLNRGAIYNGPLVVLINRSSASASELLAQILKTRHRAIIIGSNSYGKATGQILIPLDTSYNMYEEKKRYNEKDGYLKLTTEKIYDLNGTTYQKTGVEPHIQIPDIWDRFQSGEDEYENALSNDHIEKKVQVNTMPDEKIARCVSLSKQRVESDRNFVRLKKLTDSLYLLPNRDVKLLYPPDYMRQLKRVNELDSVLEKETEIMQGWIEVRSNTNTGEIMKMDELLQLLIQEEINELKKDIILRETYNILTDYNTN